MDSPTGDDVDRFEQALGWRPTRWRRAAPGRPTSANVAHWIVGDDSTTAFIKMALTAPTGSWLRAEYRTLGALAGPWLPTLLGFWDDGVRPVLALEDLSEARWPPPWSSGDVGLVVETLSAVRATAAPAHLQPFARDPVEVWDRIADDPTAFLAVGICSREWLEQALPVLQAESALAPLAGTALVHLDVRSDNLCFRNGHVILMDWNHATVANPDLDVAFWLPSLQAEGGPPPEDILPGAPRLAAWVAGYFCSHAGLPAIPDAPHVRPLQLAQARTALPWAARALGLDPPTA